MISDKDRAVVLEMCRTGMNLDVLIKCFPQFSTEDIELLYKEHLVSEERRNADGLSIERISISCNCS